MESIFDVASITKAVPVSSLALKLINDGVISEDELLIKYVPEYRGNFRDKIRIFHLLTQTLSFDFRLSDCKDLPGPQIMEAVLRAKLGVAPGERFFYANATSILLGLVIERCMNITIENAASEVFFKPLGMNRSFFNPSVEYLECIVPTEIDPWRGKLIKGEVHDESAWAMRPKTVGSAGLFSTAPDLLKFVAMLLNGGIHAGNQIFSTQIIQRMCTNQLPAEMMVQTGLGWELNQVTFMGERCSNSCFGKTGFTGCSITIDFEKKIAVVLLSNHVFPNRRKDRNEINRIRALLADAVFG
ncbi:MAG: beta-lactamase family protein [Fibrobacter sp.]|nr:beta-lactamase family protein [Fibrobacter sp.]